MQKWPLIRDICLFFGGLAGAAHETLIASAERPTLIILFATMMGLPAFIKADSKKDEEREDRKVENARKVLKAAEDRSGKDSPDG